MDENIASLRSWVGRTTAGEDVVTPRLVAAYKATLAPHVADAGNGALPLGLHWCLAPEIVEGPALGPDGHPAKRDFLPPVPLPRRMWAGSDVRFLGTLATGERMRRRSTIAKVERKNGRSGPLCFVTVRQEIACDAVPVVEEDQIIVYREAATGAAAPAVAPPPPAPHERRVAVDPVLLFRYSALTFNAHRIHYDLPYASEVENYPGLVIHGPLQATLLLNFAAAVDGRPPRQFSFRSVRPATGPQTLTLRASPDAAGGLALAVQAADGGTTMEATARW